VFWFHTNALVLHIIATEACVLTMFLCVNKLQKTDHTQEDNIESHIVVCVRERERGSEIDRERIERDREKRDRQRRQTETETERGRGKQ